ncbi:MAG: hypothetical protein ABJH63_19610 [Rhizobiaceae bacterium]
MSWFVLIKIFASVVTGMLGIPLGMLPSVLLFRGLADGVDDNASTKRRYAQVLWGGMIMGWILASVICWVIISSVFA